MIVYVYVEVLVKVTTSILMKIETYFKVYITYGVCSSNVAHSFYANLNAKKIIVR